jgi:hypothetical protein
MLSTFSLISAFIWAAVAFPSIKKDPPPPPPVMEGKGWRDVSLFVFIII